MMRGTVAGVVSMGLVLAGCGAVTLTESSAISVQPAPEQRVQAPLTGPRTTSYGALRPSGRVAMEPGAVADGETAVEIAVPPMAANASVGRLGPSMPQAAGPVRPGTETQQAVVAPGPVNLYSHTMAPQLSPAVVNVPLRVYVPNSDDASVSVIDPTTMKVVDRFNVGTRPHHVTPSWDLTKLYVNNTEGNTLTEIDPRSGKPVKNIPITDPYNLYFTPDGTKAIVVAERYQRLDFYNTADWSFLKLSLIHI